MLLLLIVVAVSFSVFVSPLFLSLFLLFLSFSSLFLSHRCLASSRRCLFPSLAHDSRCSTPFLPLLPRVYGAEKAGGQHSPGRPCTPATSLHLGAARRAVGEASSQRSPLGRHWRTYRRLCLALFRCLSRVLSALLLCSLPLVAAVCLPFFALLSFLVCGGKT